MFPIAQLPRSPLVFFAREETRFDVLQVLDQTLDQVSLSSPIPRDGKPVGRPLTRFDIPPFGLHASLWSNGLDFIYRCSPPFSSSFHHFARLTRLR